MDFVTDLETLQTTALEALSAVATPEALEAWRIEYLGSKGKVKAAMAAIKDIPKEQKGAYGKTANGMKQALTAAFDEKKPTVAAAGPKGPIEDITLPGRAPRVGRPHIITQTINEITDIFGRMGFDVVYGPEVEDEQHNFIDLNIPERHPARDPLENFYIDIKAMLRSQTSTVQIRTMETSQPPIRVVAPGRVYRPDTVDATHSFMFHQFEGLFVDEGVTMVNLRTCVDQFCKAYFGEEIVTRFRPSFFPFTEPSAEVDVLFHMPNGETKWIEIGGCGMVDPNVFGAVNIDPERYTGWAFGFGIERLVMRKHNIPDIRTLYESDVRFLHQF
ncbi:MAG: phenylalanine--tRNA ligase subunit alpha [Phycisphaerales bacterium]|jgi:phenylalanyl-tRNA synthetase alpha chain|nr:phenylalanine--tRNA ligase subunit alpha [Phycisphaerales bacterium]MBT7170287.1 phenylalanine--tRNA ligase subunit alpha [Phycisphaerales bacterium]